MPPVDPEIQAKIPTVRAYIDRSSWRTLSLSAAGWTLLFALIYTCCTIRNRGDGLKIDEYPEYRVIAHSRVAGLDAPASVSLVPDPIPWSIACGNALYFSIATETTVGYGDLVPHGASRFFACLQAFGGLMFAGVFVTKITTGLTGKTKVLVHRVEGKWIEFCLTRDCLIVSLITIEYVDGLLHYDGHNYNLDGSYRRYFSGSSQPLGTIDGATIWFDYTNLRGDNKTFKEGKTSLVFQCFNPAEARYDRFEGEAEDSGDPVAIPLIGFRANEAEAGSIAFWKMSEADKVQRERIARNCFARYKEEIKAFAEKRKIDFSKYISHTGGVINCDEPL